jgi:MFS family permease
MRPITRETITDRRQPALRWSAVFAGATVAVALWVLLQMLGIGAGLATVDVIDAGSRRTASIGTTVWTLFAPLVALFIGGLVAGRLASTYDAKVGAMHGFIAWAFASLLGMFATISAVSMLTGPAMHGATAGLMSDDVRVHPNMRAAELQQAADSAGKMLLGAGISLLVGLGAAVGGGVLAARKPTRKRRITAEVTVVPPPPEPPPDAPHVTSS